MLNRNRPFGQISPGYRGATFEQVGTDGVKRFYNSSGYEVDIRNGVTIEGPEKAGGAPAADAKSRPDKAKGLLEEKDKPPFHKWAVRAAALIGGDNPPSTKTEIVAALEKLAAPEAPVAVVAPVQDAPAPEAAPEAATVTDPQPLVDDERVDLRAWARGEAQYVFTDVAAAIRAAYARDVTSKADAIDALAEAGLIHPKDAAPTGLSAINSDALAEDEAEEAALAAEVKADDEAAMVAIEAERTARAEAEAAAVKEAAAPAKKPEKQPKPEKQKKVG